MALIGYHVSVAGKLSRALVEAEVLGCEVIQIFTGPPQQWDTPNRSSEEINDFRSLRNGMGLKKVLVHSSYLPNPASAKSLLRNLSKKKLKDEIKIAYAIGADGYNFHLGSNSNSQEGLALVIDTLNRLAELTASNWPIRIFLENDAGSGNKLGKTTDELAVVWSGLEDKSRFGITLDTCHLFASGIDLRDRKALDDWLDDFDKKIGLQHLEWIHANDSIGKLGSHLDRHANIGKGELGEATFKMLINHPKLKRLPFIMETPRSGTSQEDMRDIKILKRLRGD